MHEPDSSYRSDWLRIGQQPGFDLLVSRHHANSYDRVGKHRNLMLIIIRLSLTIDVSTIHTI